MIPFVMVQNRRPYNKQNFR